MRERAGVVAAWVGSLELGEPQEVKAVWEPFTGLQPAARVWVRLHGEPLGFVDLPLEGHQPEGSSVVAAQPAAWSKAVARHLREDGIASAEEADPARPCRYMVPTWQEPITVVIATKGRAHLVAASLQRMKAVDYPEFEVILVDGTMDGTTKGVFHEAVGEDRRFRYVHEPAPGLSRARNVGLAEARFDHVAFTDDDCRADPLWLRGLARGFGRGSEIGCVTGMVPSAQLDTFAQQYFDGRVWWSASLAPAVHRPQRQSGDSPLHPFRMGIYGTGANFAVQKDLVGRLGGFSELLGAGSPCRGGGEDGDMFVRTLRAGHAIAYEPSAMVWHQGRLTDEGLREQMQAYGRGISVTGLKWLSERDTRADVLRRAPRAASYYLSLLWRRGYGGDSARAGMALTELAGMVTGVYDFAKGYRAIHRDGGSPSG